MVRPEHHSPECPAAASAQRGADGPPAPDRAVARRLAARVPRRLSLPLHSTCVLFLLRFSDELMSEHYTRMLCDGISVTRTSCHRNHEPTASAVGARFGCGAAARQPRVARRARAARREARPLAPVARRESRTLGAALRPRHSRPLATSRRRRLRFCSLRAHIPALASSYVTFYVWRHLQLTLPMARTRNDSTTVQCSNNHFVFVGLFTARTLLGAASVGLVLYVFAPRRGGHSSGRSFAPLDQPLRRHTTGSKKF